MLSEPLPLLLCFRCGHKWIPNKSQLTCCPKCKAHLVFTRCLTCKKSVEDLLQSETEVVPITVYMQFIREHTGENHKVISYLYKKRRAER